MFRVLGKSRFLHCGFATLSLLGATACSEPQCIRVGSQDSWLEVEDLTEWVDEEGNFLGNCNETCETIYADEYECTVSELIPEMEEARSLGGSGGVGAAASESTAGTVVVHCEPLEEYCFEGE